MKRKSIFKKTSQNIDAAFIEAGLPEKVLLVPLDFAKSTHYACFCDGLGRYLRQAFTVKLRGLTRQRRRIVHLGTAVKNRIHTHADRLFPGFLSKESAVAPFSKASLELMSKSFSAASLGRRTEKTLARQLTRQGVRDGVAAAAKLKQQARIAIIADEDSVRLSACLLDGEMRLYRELQNNLEELDRACARLLAQTPEAFITSIKGIGITLVSSICAEVGSLAAIRDGDSLNAYAGIAPKVKQTGGPEAEHGSAVNAEVSTAS